METFVRLRRRVERAWSAVRISPLPYPLCILQIGRGTPTEEVCGSRFFFSKISEMLHLIRTSAIERSRHQTLTFPRLAHSPHCDYVPESISRIPAVSKERTGWWSLASRSGRCCARLGRHVSPVGLSFCSPRVMPHCRSLKRRRSRLEVGFAGCFLLANPVQGGAQVPGRVLCDAGRAGRSLWCFVFVLLGSSGLYVPFWRKHCCCCCCVVVFARVSLLAASFSAAILRFTEHC